MLVFHAFPAALPGGFVGVDVFFVVSGYLITGILLAGRTTFAGFYARRIRRLFPALIVVCAGCVVWGWFTLFADAYAELGAHLMGGAGFVSNLVLWSEAGYFDDAADTKPLQHLWSLGIEEQFYLVWPWLLAAAPSRRVSAAIALASFAACVVLTPIAPVAAFYGPLTRVWELALGAVLVGAPSLGRWRDAGALAGLALIGVAAGAIGPEDPFPGWRAALPAVGTMLVLAAGPEAWLNQRILSARSVVGLGLISYPLYLWHWPLLVFARLGGPPPAWERVALLLASLGLAWLTWALVERPLRSVTAGPALVAVLGAGMVGVFLVGLGLHQSGGVPDRPVDRSDAAHFVAYYQRLKARSTAVYREECDFMEWATERMKPALDEDCTRPGARETLFLWGDSHAQALGPGIRAHLPAGVRLAQVATSGCAPDLRSDERCRASNAYALERIVSLRPAAVIVAQSMHHEDTDWVALADHLAGLGVERVVVVGPAPVWRPSLPRLVAKRWGEPHDRVADGLETDRAEIDARLKARLAGVAHLRYVSLLDVLCDHAGCLAVVPGTDDLVTIDAGHLSPEGSVLVAERALWPALVDLAQ